MEENIKDSINVNENQDDVNKGNEIQIITSFVNILLSDNLPEKKRDTGIAIVRADLCDSSYNHWLCSGYNRLVNMGPHSL